jgi:hypothetical protein
MAKPEDHNKAIARLAAEALQPLGFTRKGRARVWIADEGLWVSIVEFQPTSFGRGSYLNVAAHWLWSSPGFLNFNYLHREPLFVEFDGSGPYEDRIAPLMHAAVSAVRDLRSKFATLESLRAFVAETARHPRASLHDDYDAAVLGALAGDLGLARTFFEKIALHGAERDWEVETQRRAAALAAQIDSPGDLRATVLRAIEAARVGLGLKPQSIAPI